MRFLPLDQRPEQSVQLALLAFVRPLSVIDDQLIYMTATVLHRLRKE